MSLVSVTVPSGSRDISAPYNTSFHFPTSTCTNISVSTLDPIFLFEVCGVVNANSLTQLKIGIVVVATLTDGTTVAGQVKKLDSSLYWLPSDIPPGKLPFYGFNSQMPGSHWISLGCQVSNSESFQVSFAPDLSPAYPASQNVTLYCSKLKTILLGNAADAYRHTFQALTFAIQFMTPELNFSLPPNSTVASFLTTSWLDRDASVSASSGNYMAYLNGCLPTSCSYQISVPPDIVTMFTIVLGLIGGIASSLTAAVPFLFLLVPKRLYTRIDEWLGWRYLIILVVWPFAFALFNLYFTLSHGQVFALGGWFDETCEPGA